MDDLAPLWVFASAFFVSALAGLAAVLRSTAQLTTLGVTSNVLNSGLMGLGISLLWYTKFKDNVYLLIGICVLSGLGGVTTVEFIVAAIRKGGLTIKIGDTVKLGDAENDNKDNDEKKNGK